MAEGRRWALNAVPRSGRRITTHQMRMQIRERYEAGATAQEIADQIGIHQRTVLTVLRDLGVTMRPACRRPVR